jgi:processed acidic surface protein
MKKIGIIILMITLLAGLMPQSAAAQSTDFDQVFAQYLDEVSQIRGFEVSKEDLEAIIVFYGYEVGSIESLEEFKQEVGEPIKADLSNLTYIYDDYNLDEVSLKKLLADNGETLDDYIYIIDLYYAVYFYESWMPVEQEEGYTENLQTYLTEVSNIRGFEVTKEDIENLLMSYSLDDFESIEQLRTYLGDVIKSDLSNLDYFKTDYNLDKQAVLDLLEDNGENINDYIYMNNLEFFIMGASESYNNDILDGITTLLPSLLEAFGLSDNEIKNIEDHFNALEDHFLLPETLNQLTALDVRIRASSNFYSDFEEDKLPTDDELSEIASIYEELLSIFKLKMVFTLIDNGKETTLSFKDIFQFDNMETYDFENASLKLSIYNTDSKLLADLMLSESLFDAEDLDDIIKETTEDIVNVVDTSSKPAKPSIGTNKNASTIKGGKLPKTASNYIVNILFGVSIIVLGSFVYLKLKKENSESIESKEIPME